MSAELTPPGVSEWSRRRQQAGVVVWASFLVACVATMAFFACFDPLLLGADDDPPIWFSNRMTGYAIGFFCFWATTAASALLTMYLLDTPRGPQDLPSELRR